MPDQRETLRKIRTFPQLIKFLRDEMDWPIEADDFEELTFDYTPEELGIDASSAAKIQEIKRLRPLSAGQPWGIFFVKFEVGQLPVVALRRILSRVVLKKRASANSTDRAAWQADDLLFISNYGEGDARQISFAHFSTHRDKADLPTLMVLGWDSGNTALRLDDVADKLTTNLSWPEGKEDAARWRERWRSAFTLRHREVITTSKILAERLADLAQGIRRRVNEVLRIESKQGPLRRLHAAFKETLIHDLEDDDFADMYAQTIAYGLLTARVSRPSGLVAENLRDMVPVTNPFLKDLLESFLDVGGRKGRIDFDELGISEIVQLLRDADMPAVLRDFGDKNPEEDPAIHFYESFLKEYDPEKRMQRGVFYTPRPVVSYIVRSVHELLQTEFGLENGLASTVTWREMGERHKSLKIPDGVSPDSAFVQVLDPATGTATFLVEVIDVIYRTLQVHWKKQQLTSAQQRAEWNDYVPKHLLPRVYGYELMMAPYAIAHMKVGLKLYETGYRFDSNERARIFLTNTLEPPGTDKAQREFEEWAPALAHEAKAVNIVKKSLAATVVIGNPPYSNYGMLNKNPWILSLLDDYKKELGEKKLNLDDDFIKFTRYGQWRIRLTGAGILAFITNHIYVTGITHRAMRHSLMESFDAIEICDLHGNSKKGEISPDGKRDENVFDIQQGVAIGVFRLGLAVTKSCKVRHSELWGARESKYAQLALTGGAQLQYRLIDDIERTSCLGTFWFFEPRASDNIEEYCAAWSLKDVFVDSGQGVKTERDGVSIHWTAREIREAVDDFRSLDETALRRKYDLQPDSRDWKVRSAKQDVLSHINEKLFREILYRPFDVRYTWYSGQTRGFIGTPGRQTMVNMLEGTNIGLVVPRQVTGATFCHVFCSRIITEIKLASHDRASSLFPLYVNLSETKNPDLFESISDTQQCNLSSRFVSALTKNLENSATSSASKVRPNTVTPRQTFGYIYAVLHSPVFRSRYVEFLKIDHPRVPLPSTMELYLALSAKGAELIALHLLESPAVDQILTPYKGRKNAETEKISRVGSVVWLDRAQTCGFHDVPEAVWNFQIGGYQVCEKWLKDRKGRALSNDDVAHYQKIVVAVSETIRLMKEIDEVIEKHGGWPGAFAT